MPPFTLVDGLRVVAAIGLVWASFAAVGAGVLILYTSQHPQLDAINSPGGLWLRLVLFGALSAGCGYLLWRLRPSTALVANFSAGSTCTRRHWTVLACLLGLIACLLGYHLAEYPWAAPDEVHHLVVARNLALHGAYASGHPDASLTYFDSFDSVGPTVLGPIAAAFKVFGVSLGAARAVMITFYLLLSLAVFRLVSSWQGGWAGITAVALLTGTFSSIYLGRTLYGEVPAFAFLLGGLLAWQRALGFKRAMGWGLLAGVGVGAAVLSKTIVALVLFSLAGAWAYDQVTFRKIRWGHVLWPAMGGIAVMASWGVIQRLHGPGAETSGSTLAIYQHYLLFGLASVPEAIMNSVAYNPVAHLVFLGLVIASVPTIFLRRYTPIGVTLYLYALFSLYWWFCFTPGQLHRYLWNSYAILAMFAAPWLVWAIQRMLQKDRPPRQRLAYLLVALLLVGPGARWLVLQTQEIATHDEMTDERALIAALDDLPPGCRLATTSGRVPGLVNFFGGPVVETGEDIATLLAGYDVVIVPEDAPVDSTIVEGATQRIAGNFVLLSSSVSLGGAERK